MVTTRNSYPQKAQLKRERDGKKKINSNWKWKKKGYSKLWSKDVHKILATNVLFLWILFRVFFSE